MISPIPSRPTFTNLLLIPTIFTTIFQSIQVNGYVPALPVNDTSRMNLTDASTIAISWSMPAGVFSGPVSFQLQADVRTGGTTSGALVHFTESTMGPNRTTSTPWIAYISCDANETGASMEWDVFTLARDRGAVSAQSCLLNSEYITDFEKPLDVFATETLQVARIIDSQFNHTNATFWNYNGTLLNNTGNQVNISIGGQALSEQSFLIGTLTARNSTGQATPTNIPGATESPSDSGGRRQPSAMIALYVVTGCILAMFVLMIFMAARRAIRHPERYGRREGDENQAPQTRTQGIAQALLDTFPIIKFSGSRNHQSSGRPKTVGSDTETETVVGESRQGSSSEENDHHNHTNSDKRQETARTVLDVNRDSIAMKSLHSAETRSLSFHSAMDGDMADDVSIKSVERQTKIYPHGQVNRQKSSTSSFTQTPSASASASGSVSRRTSRHDLMPVLSPGLTEMPGEMEEQCPICLIDFEEGDDLRVLPCEREHVYHQSCIDPWLLNVSSSCPLCRKDFNHPPSDTQGINISSGTNQPPTASGFAKYLAFMRRERRRSSTRRTSGEDNHSSVSGFGRRRATTGTSGTSSARIERDDTVGPQAGPGPFP